MWKVEPANYVTEYLAAEIYKQNIEGAAWVLLTAYSKMLEERDELKKKLWSKKERENSQPIHIAKNEETYSQENTGSVAEQAFDKEIMDTTHGFNQPS